MIILMEEKGFAPILLLFIILVSGALIVGAYYLDATRKANILQGQQQIPQSQINNSQQALQEKEFQISGSEVIQLRNGQKSVLFKNVSDVSEVRLGPDSRTLHFRVTNFDNQKQQELCADLESKVQSPPPDYGIEAPPTAPPWDYQKIAHAYTINHCNTYNAGGYLKSSDYFVYLKLTSPTQGQLYYENLKTGEIKQVTIKSESLTGFNDGYEAKGTIIGKTNSYWVNAIVGKDGTQYFYPQQDSYLQNKYLVLALGRLIVAIDVQTNALIGEFAQEGVVATSFHFLSQSSLPFVVVESAWEGPAVFNEIIDVSSGNFKTVKLAQLDKRPLLGFKIEPIEWKNDSILFHFTDVEDITIPEDFLKGKDLGNMKDEDIVRLNKQLEDVLSNQGKYQKIICDLHLGMFTPGCEGLKGMNNYNYTAENGLSRL